MSLLLDALKKVEKTRSGVAQTDSTDPDDLARAAGHRLFEAKAAPARGKLGIVPLAIISGLLLAAGGGYYVWREMSPAQPAHRPDIKPADAVAQPAAQAENKSAAAALSLDSAVVEQDHSSKVVATKAVADSMSRSAAPVIPAPPSETHPARPVRIERHPSNDGVNPTLLAAWQAYRDSDFATSWQLYRTVLQQDGKNRDALLGMAAIARQQGRDDVAAQYYGHVLALNPRDPTAHAGMSTLASGDTASTESKLKLQLAYRPDSATLHFALGNLYAEQSRWGEANQSYTNAYKRNPEDAQLAYNLAISLDHLGQGARALPYYQRVLQLDQSTASGINREQVQQRVNELIAP